MLQTLNNPDSFGGLVWRRSGCIASQEKKEFLLVEIADNRPQADEEWQHEKMESKMIGRDGSARPPGMQVLLCLMSLCNDMTGPGIGSCSAMLHVSPHMGKDQLAKAERLMVTAEPKARIVPNSYFLKPPSDTPNWRIR